jgi:hypothetical protein
MSIKIYWTTTNKSEIFQFHYCNKLQATAGAAGHKSGNKSISVCVAGVQLIATNVEYKRI